MIGEFPLKIVSFLIVIIMILIIPVMYQFKTVDTVSYNTVYEYTEEFVTKCSTQGQVTKQLFENYVNKISILGVYDIKVEHQEKIYVPDPGDPALYQEVYVSTFNSGIFDDSIYNTSVPASDRVYNMNAEDYLVVTLNRTSYTFYEALKMRLTGSSTRSGYYIRIGEMVKNEHN